MIKTTRRGFTLVEMTVVMAIMAILALIGIAVLVNLKNSTALDGASQDIVSALREAQNKAFSVANAPNSTVIPIAWGLEINSGTKTITPFYIKADTWEKVSLTGVPLPVVNITPTGYFIFTAPFGKYYSTSNLPVTWGYRNEKPNDAVPGGTLTPIQSINLEYKGNTKSVVIETNGDVHVE